MEKGLSAGVRVYVIEPFTNCVVEDTPVHFTNLQSLVYSVSQLRGAHSLILIRNHQYFKSLFRRTKRYGT
jgi:hypothetical protein